MLECSGDPYYSTAEFTVSDTTSGAQTGKCVNGFSDASNNVFSAFFCQDMTTLAAFKDPGSGVFSNTHGWSATGLDLLHGRITDPSIPSDTVLMGACTKDGWAQWCSSICPATRRYATTYCDKTCDAPDYSNQSDSCKVLANNLFQPPLAQTLNAGGTFVPAAQGTYRVTGESRMVHASLVAPNACAVDVQVGPGQLCRQDLGGGLAANPTASTYGGVLNDSVLGTMRPSLVAFRRV